MPPATNTGTSSASVGRISCASTLVDTGPIWPPASIPSITSASTPERTSFLASASVGAKQMTLAPEALIASRLPLGGRPPASTTRSEEHTSELQSLMRNSYAVFCLNKKKHKKKQILQ